MGEEVSRQWVPPGMRRVWKLIVVLFVVVALVAIGWLYVLSERNYYSCEYTVLAESSSDSQFTLQLPVPSNLAGAGPADLATMARITGSSAQEMVNTSYGKALKVTGAGRIEVEWSSRSDSTTDQGFFALISMFNGSLNFTTGKESTWVFCDDPDVSMYLEYHASIRRMVSPWFASGTTNHFEFLMPSGSVGWRPVATDYWGCVSN